MKSQTTVFLSLMTAIYIVSNIIPFNIGEPLWVFFGVLFSYFAGSICIAYIYVLNTVWVASNIFSITTVSESTAQAYFVLTDSAFLMPIPLLILVLIAGTYLGCFTGIGFCRAIIKKLHLLEKFGGIYV
jgi:hypothetical protein